MLTYALIVRLVLVILTLLKCVLQHIQQQQAVTEATLHMLMPLRHPS